MATQKPKESNISNYDPTIFSQTTESQPAPAPVPLSKDKSIVLEIKGQRVDVFFEKIGSKEIKVSCESTKEFSAFYSELCKVRPNMSTLFIQKKEKYLTTYADKAFWKDIKEVQDNCLKNTSSAVTASK